MKIGILIVLIAGVFVLSANSATLVINDGQLMGATDVEVGGKFYDVSFLDGSCNSLYSGCSNFTFNTLAAATLASQALLDQVFIGVYDDEPSLTNGISSESVFVGLIITPAGRKLGPLQDFIGQSARNYHAALIHEPDDVLGPVGSSFSWDTTDSATWTFAVWSQTAVPLPAAVPISAAWWRFATPPYSDE